MITGPGEIEQQHQIKGSIGSRKKLYVLCPAIFEDQKILLL
jgi:hypothetical protein